MLHKAKPRLKCKGYNLISSTKGSLDNSQYSNHCTRFGKALVQGIPVLSIFALVGIFGFATNPDLQKLIKQLFPAQTCSATCAPSLESTDCANGYHWEGSPTCSCVPDSTPQPTTPTTGGAPSASIVIDNGVIHDTIQAGRGVTAYTSHTINVNASNIESYQLTLTPTKTLSGPSSMGNASGQKGANMNNNTWGYGWGSTATAEADLTYNSLATSVTLPQETVNNNAVNFSKKLTFAAKFGDNANDGTYNASIKLALTVTPSKIVAWDDMVYMQDMSPAACASAATGATKTLKDLRVSKWQNTAVTNGYTIIKAADGNCWMTSNLRLVSYDITANNYMLSDVTPGTTFSIAPYNYYDDYRHSDGFTGTNNNAAIFSSDATYGSYYSWYTATAGTGTSSLSSGDAPSSICPKGWKLPKGGTGGDFQALYNKWTAATWTTNGGKNGRWLGAANAASGGVFFSAAGYYVNSSASNVGADGRYWSRTAYDANLAYDLYLNSNNAGPAGYSDKYFGFSVRCVAYSS